ncbi:MAG: hypothetical protein JWO44_950 [Bacteroidetes bacterium]|nr:hypothetical protein [Bacteroidota bacterium]
MKKLTLTTILLFAFALISNVSVAQSNVETLAKKAAKDAGCLGDYHGGLEITSNVIGTCTCEDGTTCDLYEVLVKRKVNPQEAPYVRYAPFAKVTICGTEVTAVECLIVF